MKTAQLTDEQWNVVFAALGKQPLELVIGAYLPLVGQLNPAVLQQHTHVAPVAQPEAPAKE